MCLVMYNTTFIVTSVDLILENQMHTEVHARDDKYQNAYPLTLPEHFDQEVQMGGLRDFSLMHAFMESQLCNYLKTVIDL